MSNRCILGIALNIYEKVTAMSYIPDSELVLTPDGKIYHLGLRPGDIAETIITVGDPERVKRISRHFDSVEVEAGKREFVAHTGRVGQKRITVLSTGIGPDNIDIAINELDALVNFDFDRRAVKESLTSLRLIRLGTSGAIQEDLDPGTLVISRFGIGLDNLMYYYQYQNTLRESELWEALQEFLSYHFTLPTTPYVFEGSGLLAESLSKGLEQGITLTSPGFYGPQGRQLRAPVRFGGPELDQLRHFRFGSFRITNFEMETSALFGLARLLGHEAISCNVILGNRIKKTFVDSPYAVVDHMIELQLERIAAL